MDYHTPSGRLLRIGIHTPILVQTPRGHAGWEEKGSAEDLRRIAAEADRLGYRHLTCSEHAVIPAEAAGRRGSVYWDPLSTLAWLAAGTSQIQLATNVVVIGYHHPAQLIKSYGTLDRLSGGRVILGMGVGTLREEFDLLGARFDERGARADDAIRAIRAGWGRSTIEYHGSHFDYGPFITEPHSPRDRVPIWIGGSTRRSLRRAIELGDGWTPFGRSIQEIAKMLADVQLPEPFAVVLSSEQPLDPAGSPGSTIETLDELASAGANALHATFVNNSVEHYLEQLEALSVLVHSTR